MQVRVTVVAIILSLTLGLSGCAEDMRKMSAALEEFNTGVKSGSAGSGAMAVQSAAGQSKPTQLVPPSDKKVAAAMNEALPTIKKVLAIHQCVRENQSLRKLNFYAVAGHDLSAIGSDYGYAKLYPLGYMPYHDQNKCVSVQALDNWSMPALNALAFRAVFFAEDSGETQSFMYMMKKADDGDWRLAALTRQG